MHSMGIRCIIAVNEPIVTSNKSLSRLLFDRKLPQQNGRQKMTTNTYTVSEIYRALSPILKLCKTRERCLLGMGTQEPPVMQVPVGPVVRV